MAAFADLVASRRKWIHDELVPWCLTATSVELAMAEQVWPDLAGRVAPQYTLWIWAWQRFPGLVIPDLDRFDEALEVEVTLRNGEQFTGFPDARRTQRDQLVLVSSQLGMEVPPLGLDDIAGIRPLRPIVAVPDRTITPSPEV
jgi:hypothetical protein